VVEPRPRSRATYDELFGHYRQLYFALGSRESRPVASGGVLPSLRKIAAAAKKS
jgi:L-ribulokinase